MSPRPAKIDDATRLRAIELSERIGPAAAARELGLNVNTLKSLRLRAGLAGPSPGDVDDRVGRLRSDLAGARSVKEASRKRLLQALDDGESRDARDLSVSWGIASDKARDLQAALDGAEERQARLDHQDAETLLAVIGVVWESIGVPLGPCRPVIASVLRMAEAGAPMHAREPQASEARAAVRAHFERKLREASEEHPAVLPLLLEPPAEAEPEPEAEIVDGVVIDEQPARRPEPPREPKSMVLRRAARADFSARGY